jgi:two-component system response regulator CpxR
MSIIAMVSGVFCSGEEIATRVAERLGYRLVGDGLLETAAKQFGTSEKKLARAMAGDRSLFNSVTHEYEKSVIYLKAASAELLTKDELVYHGPAAYLMPQSIGHVLRVGVQAGLEYRIERAAEEGLDVKAAERFIHKRDEELAAWTQELKARTTWDSAQFDIKIPLPETEVDAAVDLVCAAITKTALMPTDRSIQAALDFLLATQVNLALLQRGHVHCDVSSNRGRIVVEAKQKSVPAGALGRTVGSLRLEKLEDDAQKIGAENKAVRSIEVLPIRKQTRTLLVDDEQEFVVTLSERLGMREIESSVVFDGEQALDFVANDEPEVMVLDLRMPGIDGVEVLRRVKNDHPRIEVIVVTAHGTEKDERIVRELGAFDYLEKPVDIKTLAEKIKAASEKVRSESADGPEGD